MSQSPADLLAMIASLGADPWPTIYAVAGGYIVKPARPADVVAAPVIRLRALADNLFMPTGAELEPALLSDEAAGLVRSRGLVFLPGERVLGFDAAQTLGPASLISIPSVVARDWRPPPQRPAYADQLRAIVLERPGEAVDAIVDSGGAGVGEEEPRPAAAGPLAGLAGSAQAALGRGLLRVANELNWRGLARFAAGLIGSAVNYVPRLSESLLGKQEAALRALLQEFREGNLERALRRALPLGDGASRGVAPHQGSTLPWHSARFSLRDLLAEGGGPGAVWFTGSNLRDLLVEEYRRAAAAAAKNGDHRRAAFIYGKLLRDYRRAAAALERGGLHHEAAILYLKKIKDYSAAARAFAAAGETDRALQLFRDCGEHVNAGDLLRNIGDDDGALAEYTVAADLLARGGDWLQAGELMLKRAQRDDLALAYLRSGWGSRPAGNAVPCALRLANVYSANESPGELLALVDDADEYFAKQGQESDASHFYDEVARVAEKPHLKSVRDDLRDRALRGIADRIRVRASFESRPGTVVSSLLGRSGLWDATLVSDAEFAFKGALQHNDSIAPARENRTCLHRGDVTAVCATPTGSAVFVGYSDGTIAAFRTGERRPRVLGCSIAKLTGAVTALATDWRGKMLVAISQEKSGVRRLSSYCHDTGAEYSLRYDLRHVREWPYRGPGGLSPIRQRDSVFTVVLREADAIDFLEGLELVPTSRGRLQGWVADRFAAARTFAAAWCGPPSEAKPDLLVFADELLLQVSREGAVAVAEELTPYPVPPYGSSLRTPSLSSLHTSASTMELASVNAAGEVWWSEIAFVLRSDSQRHSPKMRETRRLRSNEGPFLAATLVAPGKLIAVRSTGVARVRVSGSYLLATELTSESLPDALACYFCTEKKTLLIVCANGDLVQVLVELISFKADVSAGAATGTRS
jgi:tetratricopeptide (TPR) repeat protein